MFFPSLIAWIYFVLLAPSSASERPGFLPLAVYAVGKFVQFGLPVFWFLVLARARPVMTRIHWSGVRTGLGFGLLVAGGILLLYFGVLRGSVLLAETPAKVRDKIALFHATTPARFILLALFLSGIHSFLEEYYWRWFIFGQLRRLIHDWPANIVSSLAFMGHHVIVLGVYFPGRFFSLALPFSLCVALGGGVWAWLYARERTLVAPWLSHMMVDGAIMAIGYSMVFSAAA
jgi:membrane protease YdiL (CAAX protease family)